MRIDIQCCWVQYHCPVVVAARSCVVSPGGHDHGPGAHPARGGAILASNHNFLVDSLVMVAFSICAGAARISSSVAAMRAAGQVLEARD